MAVPKQRKTKSRRDQRRSHIHLKEHFLVTCPKCHKMILAHTLCKNCGYYKGRQIVDVLARLNKKEKKQKEKKEKERQKEERDNKKGKEKAKAKASK